MNATTPHPLPGNRPARHARAYWLMRPGLGEIRSEVLRSVAADQLLIRTSYSGISRGTELLVHRGMVPPRIAGQMRCPFQAGVFPGPVKYGYSAVGTVVDGPPEWLERDVFCLYPHQDLFAVPIDAVLPLPRRVPRKRAVLTASMETALNAIWDANMRRGDQVCVIGAGVIGLLTGYLAQRLYAARVTVTDIDHGKAEIAARLGLAFADDPERCAGARLIFHASGSPDGLRMAFETAGFEGKIIELSWYGTQQVTLDLGAEFHARRLMLQASQVSAVSPSRRVRWTHSRRAARALSLLGESRLDSLITGESRFADLPETMTALAEGRLSALCHRIVYD